MDTMKCGDLVTVALPGDYGKPRPSLVIQADAFALMKSTVVLRITSTLKDRPLFRVTVEPAEHNGLRKRSQIMIDKPATVPRAKVGRRIGRLDEETMRTVNTALHRFLGCNR